MTLRTSMRRYEFFVFLGLFVSAIGVVILPFMKIGFWDCGGYDCFWNQRPVPVPMEIIVAFYFTGQAIVLLALLPRPWRRGGWLDHELRGD